MLHITKGCGKMSGIDSINVSSLNNPYCQTNSKDDKKVCSKCYSNRYSKIRPPLEAALMRNTELLTKSLLMDEDIPVLNYLYFRFNSFGELYSMLHLENLTRICRKNPKTTFSLWTKRRDIIVKFDYNRLPKNLILIYSEPLIDRLNIELEFPFDKIFNVVNKKNLDIVNCSKKCITCLVCYKRFNNIKFIIERIK